ELGGAPHPPDPLRPRPRRPALDPRLTSELRDYAVEAAESIRFLRSKSGSVRDGGSGERCLGARRGDLPGAHHETLGRVADEVERIASDEGERRAASGVEDVGTIGLDDLRALHGVLEPTLRRRELDGVTGLHVLEG